jgi:HEAT repeat protein
MTMIIPALILAVVASPSGAADTLARSAAAAQRSGSITWLSWTVPSIADGHACCWNHRDSRNSGTCSLEGDGYGMNMGRENGMPVESNLVVYARVTKDGVDRLRMFSPSCRVDRGAAKVQDLSGMSASESVRYLETLVKAGEGGKLSKRRRDGALSAIAFHEDASADRALERFAKEGGTREIRRNAAFWLGNAREQAGYDALVRLRSVDDAAFREHLTFAFSQSKVLQASASLIDMARNDPSSRVRGQALFWIAQKAQKRSDADVIRAATDDPDAEVKKKAVFALSQIPNGEGVPGLIQVAQENKSREVRKQAMFWLGQSKDPRALAFFEKILSQ